ncbi:MAG: GNAT family N-acetyltransferase, partial [Thermoplasmata archaeon]
VRLKKFNSEHDPLFALAEDLDNTVMKYLRESITLDTRDVLVADEEGKIVGILLAEIIDRGFYQPQKEVRITELYVLPAYRKKGLGKKLIDEIINKEKNKGCGILTVEFPTENLLAHKFYTSQGMRSIISVYGKSLK